MRGVDLFAFQVYPYVAIAVFLIGSWLRFDYAMYTWRTGSSQLLSRRGMRVGSNLFHVGILVVLGGHLVGLLTPHALYEPFISAPHKQLLAMAVGGLFGVLCLMGLTVLLVRRLFDPRIRSTGSPADTGVLLLLMGQLLLGLYTIVVSRHHMDGATMMALAEWAQHIVTFRWGAASYVAGVDGVYKVHLALGMTLFLVAPFTRLVHVWSMPVGYLHRPYQVMRRRVVRVCDRSGGGAR